MIHPSKKDFLEKAKQGNLIPVYREILADLETPVTAFMKIDQSSDHSFLLESADRSGYMGQHSFLGANPSIVFKSKGNQVRVEKYGQAEEWESDDPYEDLRTLVEKYRPVPDPSLPPFHGGAVGYFAYDMVRFFEKLPDDTQDDLDLPDSYFVLTDTILIFDHLNHTIKILCNAHVEDTDPETAYETAQAQIEHLARLLARPLPEENAVPVVGNGGELDLKSNFTRERFEEIVCVAKEYIRQGDIIQTVLSQRFQTELDVPPFQVYRALRSVNPSPYMFYLNFGDLKLVGSSPETLVRSRPAREEGSLWVEQRPIAGTRPRGRTEEEDRALAADLLADEKERAEHIMLVDLSRNDVGRVCVSGSVRVPELMTIEYYSHVMHIVSDVRGISQPGCDAFDILKASFPMGTVTGAPKIRAMEIIEELEECKRGPYAGTVGYFSFSGSMDSCIILRTLVVKGNVAYVQAGAGIVSDSQPALEYEETRNKARALVEAIELARRGLEK